MTYEDSGGFGDEAGFPGSLRDALAPVVTARRISSPPVEAIVQGGRRRHRNQRLGLAAAGMAVLAATPLAAPALAGGSANSSSAASGSNAAGEPSAPATTTAAPATTAKPPLTDKDAAQQFGIMPKQPTALISGTAGSHTWNVTVVGGKGNNELTKDQDCLHETLYVDGKAQTWRGDPVIYCTSASNSDHGVPANFEAADIPLPGGDVTVYAATVPVGVAKVTAHIDGVSEALSASTVKLPGTNLAYFGIGAAGGVGRVTFDTFDASGTKIGSFDNFSNVPTSTATKH